MSVDVVIPEMGESITEAVIAAWLKADGDVVAMDEPICELETDKANAEMPAPVAGVLHIVEAQGATVHVGDVIARIEEGAGVAAEPTTEPTTEPEPEHAPAPAPAAGARQPAAAGDVRVGPAARRLAEERGIDPASVAPTGAGNRVTKEDIVAHGEAASPRLSLVDAPAPSAPEPPTPAPSEPASSAPEPPTPAPSAPASPAPAAAGPARVEKKAAAAGSDSADEERVAMTPIRRRIADRLVQAQQTAAILTTFNEIDMSRVMDLRTRHKESFSERHGVSLGFMGFFARACVEALQDVPQINARIDGDEIVYSKRVHLGIAASTPRGLVVPVVRNTDLLELPQIEHEIGRLAGLARENKLAVSDLTGGTFTISNGGVFGSLLSTPILNPPQSGILGMHKIEKRPVVIDDQIAIRPMMYVALSYDHRIVDGREAVTFLVKVKERIEDPERLLLSI